MGLLDVEQKVTQRAEWRGEITVMDGDDSDELTVRQLYDAEFKDVMGRLDLSEIKELKGDLPEDALSEFRELEEKDELTEEEEARKEELQEELDGAQSLLSAMPDDSFNAIRDCAKYGVVPSRDELEARFRDSEYVREKEREHGISISQPEDLYDYDAVLTDEWGGPMQDDIEWMFDHSTNLLSFQAGMNVLMETLDEEGN